MTGNLPPGIYHDLPWDDYAALDAMNHSRLSWLMDESPAFFIGMLGTADDIDTPALRFGRAAHCATLEPERFAAEYVAERDPASFTKPGGEPYASPRASKPYKEFVAALVDDGKIVIKGDEYALAVSLAHAFRDHPRVGELLRNAKGAETTLIWERDGVLCKCRLDLWGKGWNCDLKTTRNFGGFSPFEVTKYALHRQLAWYKSGALACGMNVEVSYLAVATNTIPDVALFNLELSALQAGKAEIDRGWDRYLACKKSGKWPGRYDPELVHSATLSDRRFDQLAEAGLL